MIRHQYWWRAFGTLVDGNYFYLTTFAFDNSLVHVFESDMSAHGTGSDGTIFCLVGQFVRFAQNSSRIGPCQVVRHNNTAIISGITFSLVGNDHINQTALGYGLLIADIVGIKSNTVCHLLTYKINI